MEDLGVAIVLIRHRLIVAIPGMGRAVLAVEIQDPRTGRWSPVSYLRLNDFQRWEECDGE